MVANAARLHKALLIQEQTSSAKKGFQKVNVEEDPSKKAPEHQNRLESKPTSTSSSSNQSTSTSEASPITSSESPRDLFVYSVPSMWTPFIAPGSPANP